MISSGSYPTIELASVATPSSSTIARAADAARRRSLRRSAPVRHHPPPPEVGWADLYLVGLISSIGWLLACAGLGLIGGGS